MKSRLLAKTGHHGRQSTVGGANRNTMDKFKFSGCTPSWPDWFDDLVEKGKVLITTDTDPAFENDDDWLEYWVNVAYLWTPDKIVLVYQGDTIVNRGTYCEPALNGL